MKFVFKKISAASLVETIIATIIITIVFGIAIVGVTDLLETKVKHNYHLIDAKLSKLTYKYYNGSIKVPSSQQEGKWNISINRVREGEVKTIVFEAVHAETKKTRMIKLLE